MKVLATVDVNICECVSSFTQNQRFSDVPANNYHPGDLWVTELMTSPSKPCSLCSCILFSKSYWLSRSLQLPALSLCMFSSIFNMFSGLLTTSLRRSKYQRAASISFTPPIWRSTMKMSGTYWARIQK